MATKHLINASFIPSKCCTTKLSLGVLRVSASQNRRTGKLHWCDHGSVERQVSSLHTTNQFLVRIPLEIAERLRAAELDAEGVSVRIENKFGAVDLIVPWCVMIVVGSPEIVIQRGVERFVACGKRNLRAICLEIPSAPSDDPKGQKRLANLAYGLRDKPTVVLIYDDSTMIANNDNAGLVGLKMT